MDGEETCLFLSNRRDREPNPELWREGSGANHHPGAPARLRPIKIGRAINAVEIIVSSVIYIIILMILKVI